MLFEFGFVYGHFSKSHVAMLKNMVSFIYLRISVAIFISLVALTSHVGTLWLSGSAQEVSFQNG